MSLRGFPPVRHFGKGARIVEFPEQSAVVGYDGPNELCAKGYAGKRNRPDFYIQFRSVERRDAYVAQWLANLDASAARKAADRAERLKPHDFQLGEILYSDWGYEQTNVDFFQVVEVSPKSILIQEIASELTPAECWASYTAVPQPGAFIGEPCRKVPHRGYVPVGYGEAKGSDTSASRWDGRARRVTTYA